MTSVGFGSGKASWVLVVTGMFVADTANLLPYLCERDGHHLKGFPP
jgi:hypothetical protein